MAPLSEEEENYVRLALLLKGVAPRAVRVPDSKTFDVTLMICLIRNLTSVIPPINGFDNLPLPAQTTPGSDLARIKCYRNKLAHYDSNMIDTAYFNTVWRDISDAVGRLGGQTMYQECQELRVKILDQSNQEVILEIKQSLEEMKELRQHMDNLGRNTQKKKIQEINWQRKNEQTQAGGKLKELEESWVGLVSKNYEIERACVEIEREIEEMEQKRAKKAKR
ncbi:BCAS2 [Mytilus edulis]|uniref:Pre-mRNA-splicing factor SPF27 n=1 Tax=Mytilus edulis TaxID=6550 RepID=A0A8S3VLD6_MYTED|nr:BCAS2 [Mytilus edulis]